ncbi:trifunctional serine/threonine-protein kinase/ATP-binding protein/sensor histidine kinase [Nostoc sp. 'Peltigera membranacea cyanobiont' 232]|uniref:trifunctional serine/threonine-protein kinase/ATP-binding protein/sensor histidine kinase n=1 Tax=Nostoc sp. 'Peltigera membranacea cyanobiont' 232 TaxID=2014531 RepID=UPI000B957D37|nr:ATP-binding sensor histidine kinase [Nostoc sp. 'Peltigera membranacea cyanobiont' 232]OYE01014.1 serine/threonine protein kinase [Nostoc sp. 'Peltigera membranacea cyanobiont' 232]
MVSNLASITGYRMSGELYNGSRTVVYRGYRETDSLPVVIKLLKNPYPSFSELVQFRNQYTIAKNLNSPLIISTYSLEPYQNGYALVMEDFGGISLKDYFTSDQTRYIASGQEFLEIAIALCNALDILYRQRIIHKDIKPSNILINPETKQVKLIDFSIASLLPRETQTFINPNVLEGTLAYISPEQTGRMNRGIDYRTDFYSLGVTFYELLTGELPFSSKDPMELVHCHIAKPAPNLRERVKGKEIPQVLCDLVSKLMAKNAEDRYQSALGLKFDLEDCLYQLNKTGEIKSFPIARRDVGDRFLIPDQLYGRETEVETLLQAFERVANPPESPLNKEGHRGVEMMLVAGFSGIGKTAVVNEVHKPIVRQRGYFIKGKFDQFQRNIPLSAFVQAFRDLIGQLLTESDAQIQQWKNQILEAVGENGQVIIEVIPELETIIGEQPAAIELSGTAAQNRFNLLFQKFTQVFTKPEHPLVMFLDDLQWADSASLKLMQILMADTGHLLLIGAYRDNEVNPAHAFMLTLSEIQKTQATINKITLAPLSQDRVNQLVADTLKCPESLAWTLSVLIYQKTKGNPFFVTQFLKALHQENLIQFDLEFGCWQFDIAQVTIQAVTDDIVAFMALQLGKLPPSTQEVLQLAACIGNQFDLATLAIISEQSQIETAAALWKALQSGLILPIGDVYKFYVGQDNLVVTQENQETVTYKFLHDRVQQAAYSLIPDEQKTATHLQIGQLLRQNLSEIELEEKLFDIVLHLNLGQELITQVSEREVLAQLNFKAGVKARNSTAYAAARVYFQTGMKLLQPDCWQHQYELTLNLYITTAEASYLNGDFEEMEQLAALVLQKAQTILDKVKIYEIQIAAQTAQSQILEAIAVGRDALSQLGVDLPIAADEAQINKVLQDLVNLQRGNNPSTLVNLPRMSDPTAIAAMQLLGVLFAPVLLGMPGLLPLLGATMVKLSLQFGNAPASTVGYGLHGMILCAFLGKVETGYEFGRLALSLLEGLNAQSMKSLALNLFGSFIQHHQQAVLATLPTLKDGYTTGIETGDFLYAGYNIAAYACNALFAGVEVDALSSELAAYNAVLAQMKQDSAHIYSDMVRQTLEHLRETVSQPDCLTGTIYDETLMLPKHQQDNDLTSIAIVYIYKLLLAYYFGNYQAALDYITSVKSYLMAVSGMFFTSIFHFYAALTHLALFPTQPDAEQAKLLAVAITHQTALHQWAQNAPMNHLHKWYLVEAERHRVLGEKVAASECYDQAITLAKAHQFINEEALANELAAKFYLDWDKKRIAQEYMIEAYYGYARWGAKAKVADLEKRYPQLLASILQQTRSPLSTNETIFVLGSVTSTSSPSSSSSSVSVALDLAAIFKASQRISSEIELEKLLSSLLEIVIENAGADKCVLMLLRDEHLLIEGSIILGTQPVVLQRLLVEESQDIPLKLIYKVKHNRQTTVLIDPTADPILANDPYIIRQQPQSILCSPILHQGKLLGILYLENKLTTGAFTSDRVELLNLLCAQAAISLENAQLYERSLKYAQQLEESFAELSASNSRFERLVDNVPGVVYQYSISADGVISLTYISADCYNLLEITPEQAMSNWQFFDNLVHPDDVVSYQQSNTEALQALCPWQWSGQIITPSGIIKWIHGESCIQRFADGSMVWDGLFLDISEQQAALRERQLAELALQQKSLALENALNDLQHAQLQIVQSEKMSALGNLVAGVAHEINNPVGCIIGNVEAVQNSINDLFGLIDLYNDKFPQPGTEIEEELETIDLEYLRDDLPKLIRAMKDGGDRIKSISKSLRTFSRADSDQKQTFNLHEGIDSTILILRHRLKASETRPAIEVVTNYGNIPAIACFPGQLNQVFMNILANAIDALDESNNGRSFADIQAIPNCITIQTSVENEKVKIAISDNGKGMSESVKQKIFDHLFTTKAVGKGTGLGLAIARQIVEETHSGNLNCTSVLGQGTEFVITLPVKKLIYLGTINL